MSYIVFISHSLHWRYIKTALQEYVIISFTGIITKLIGKNSVAVDQALAPWERFKTSFICGSNRKVNSGQNPEILCPHFVPACAASHKAC